MQRWKKHIWTGALLTASVLLIVAATAMGAVRLIDLVAPKYRLELASTLSDSLELPVTIGGIGMSWQSFRPSFELDEVIVLDDQRRPVFQVKHIGLPFKWGRLLRGELLPYMVELNGLAVSLEWRADGSVGISGVSAEDSGELDIGEVLDYLNKINRIEVVDGVVNWRDFGVQIGLTRIEQVNAEISRVGDGIDLSLRGRLPRHLGETFHLKAGLVGDLARPESLQIKTLFKTETLYADGWLSPVLRDTAALRGGPMKVEFSSDWQGLVFEKAALRIDAKPLKDVGGGAAVPLPGLNAELKIAPLGDGWDMDVVSLQYRYENGESPVARGHFRYQPTPDGFGTRLDAELDTLMAADVLSWMSVLDVTGEMALPVGEGITGELLNTRFEYYQASNAEPQYELSSQINGLSLPATDATPGVKGFDGQLFATQEAGRFEVATKEGVLYLPAVFAAPLPLTDFKTVLHWEQQAGGWRLFSEDLRLEMLTVDASGKLEFILDQSESPYIDLQLDFKASDILPVKPFIPLPPALPEQVGEWLQASLAGGKVTDGDFVLRGRLSDFPYENEGEEGEFRISFKAVGAALEYSPGWPVVDDIHGDAVFKGRSMLIKANRGRIIEVPVRKAVAAIPDFLNPVLEITGEVESDVGKQLSFLEKSPLREHYQGLLDAIDITGPGTLYLNFAMPLKDVEAVKVSGDIDLQGIELRYSGLPMPVTDVRGKFHFSESGLAAEMLNGRLLGVPVSAGLTPTEVDGEVFTRIQAVATIKLPDDATKFSEYIDPAQLKAFGGETQLTLDTRFDNSATSSDLLIRSDLKGMQIQLGQPFGKPADEVRELSFALKPGTKNTELKWQFSDSLHGLMEVASDADGSRLKKARIHLGESKALELPVDDAVQVTGELPSLDLSGFVFAPGGASSQLPMVMDVRLGELKIASQHFRALELKTGDVDSNSVTSQSGMLNVKGELTSGQLTWSKTESGRLSVKGDFDSLNLHVPQGLDDALESDEIVVKEPYDPAHFPVVSLMVKKFRLGNEGLGSLKLITEPTENGVRLALLEVGERRIEIRGGGEWVRSDGQSSARLVMNINGNDIIGFLNATGYAPSIEAEQADVYMELDWAPHPEGLELSQLNGKMSFDLLDGSLLDVQPGAGRVLSLLSFYSLPRRLSFDFSDVLGKGTAFDELTGDFAIRNGDATTDDLEVTLPSGRIEVRGRVGLAARDYDQTVVIYPGVSSGVALAGAVLGGPVLGIGLWIAQELLDKPFDQVAQLGYRITGSWDDPQVKPLDVKATSKTDSNTKPKASSAPRGPRSAPSGLSSDKQGSSGGKTNAPR